MAVLAPVLTFLPERPRCLLPGRSLARGCVGGTDVEPDEAADCSGTTGGTDADADLSRCLRFLAARLLSAFGAVGTVCAGGAFGGAPSGRGAGWFDELEGEDLAAAGAFGEALALDFVEDLATALAEAADAEDASLALALADLLFFEPGRRKSFMARFESEFWKCLSA